MKTQPILLALSFLCLANPVDEGQWLPQQVLAMDWDDLRRRGMKLTRDEFWHPQKGGVLTAAVQINGCSASFVSPNGLVVTNHHCGFGAVNALSTVERNYVDDGFVATTNEDELSAPGMQVYVVRRIEDVTEKIHAAQDAAGTDLERFQQTQRTIRRLVGEGEREPNTKCSISSFLEGQQYYLYYRTRIRDVRLVYAPPRSIGEFGGDVDNWEWPRHTGDFTFFRAYVAPDGTPRAYSKDNVPYAPKHYLRVSKDGVQADDLVLILGYPGRTERYLTASAVADRQGFFYPRRYTLFTETIRILEAAGETDPKLRLRLQSLIKSLANVQKNALGMVKGLARNGVVAAKQAEQQAFDSWLAGDEQRREKFGSALSDAEELAAEARKTQEKDLLLGLLLSRGLNPAAASLVSAAASLPKDPESEVPGSILKALAQSSIDANLETIGKPMLRMLLQAARELPADQALAGTEWLRDAPADQTSEALLDAALAKTKMLSKQGRVGLFRRGVASVKNSDDPLVILARGLAQEAVAKGRRDAVRDGRQLVVGRRWIAAQQAWRGKSFYPDANSTLRVSVASIKGYAPYDGARYTPFTTVQGLLDKETGEVPFANPEQLLAAALKRIRSRFYDSHIGDVPVCFLSDGDTTGGNSGSPVINGRGELVGLNFDRVFENVSGDYGWRPERSRNISVDIRYVLWCLESVIPAPRLLDEMGVSAH